MKRRVFTFMMIGLIAAAVGCGPAGNEIVQQSAAQQGVQRQSSGQVKELTQDLGIGTCIDYSRPSMQPVSQFGYELLKQNLEEVNPVLSPVSAYVALSMLGNGAQGETKEELRQALDGDMMCIPDDLMNTLPEHEKGMQLTIANSAWMNDSFTANEEWLGTVKSLFDASVYQAELKTENTADEINKWVSENTKQKIQKLLDKPLEENSELVLLNALYFEAEWEQKFDAENTFDSPFFYEHQDAEKVSKEDSEEIVERVSMMHAVIEDGRYIKDDEAEGVILPYADSRFAFAAVMPFGNETIREWYTSYDSKKLQKLLDSSQTMKVSVGLPKFTARCKKTLNDSLKNMGIQLAFDMEQADLSLLGKAQNGGNLYLNRVLQEAVIEVAEEGTKAAAATMADLLAGGAMPQDLQIVHFDRPFLYMIVEEQSGVPIFMGILDKPEE